MPVKRGIDSSGPYYQYGNQKKYHYISGSKRSRDIARKKAEKQAKAIYASRY